jgi:hypothetical protein
VIRQIAGYLLLRVADYLDRTVPPEELREFFVQRWTAFQRAPAAHITGGADDATARDLALATHLARGSGLLPVHADEIVLPGVDDTSRDLEAASRWLQRLVDGKVIISGRLVSGTGKHLDVLARRRPSDQESLLDGLYESLLRHVEVRREDALRVEAASADRTWLERHDVAIAFCRQARRRGDLRLLNAAFKLTDWAFRSHRRLAPSPRLARFLLVIAEQETSANALLAC